MSFYTILPVVISAMAVWMDFREASVDNGWILFSFVTGFLIQITERGLKGGAIFLTGVASSGYPVRNSVCVPDAWSW